MQIDKLLQDLRDKRNRLEIDPESYHLWKSHKMTQALFLDLEITYTDKLQSHVDPALRSYIEDLIDWKPAEMEDEADGWGEPTHRIGSPDP